MPPGLDTLTVLKHDMIMLESVLNSLVLKMFYELRLFSTGIKSLVPWKQSRFSQARALLSLAGLPGNLNSLLSSDGFVHV